MIARVKSLLGKYLSAPRAQNDYATHVPILIGLARMREIKNVLEFGCGHYSTLTFLNRTAFPHLRELHSVENDSEWSDAMREAAMHDNRWTLHVVNGNIADAVSTLDLEHFDLILIDDSKTAAERAATISAVAQKQPQHPWIAIHDYEVGEYQQAATGFRHRYKFRAYTPKTGLAANNAIDISKLKRLLKQSAATLAPDDVAAWTINLRHLRKSAA